MSIILGAIFAILGFVVIIVSARKIKVCTEITTAKVIDISRERSRNTNNNYNQSGISFGTNGEISLYPVYEYYVGENRFVQKSSSSKRAVFVGQTIEIHYNPNNPAEIYDGKNIMPIILGAIFVIVGIVVMVIG